MQQPISTVGLLWVCGSLHALCSAAVPRPGLAWRLRRALDGPMAGEACTRRTCARGLGPAQPRSTQRRAAMGMRLQQSLTQRSRAAGVGYHWPGGARASQFCGAGRLARVDQRRGRNS